MVFPEIEDVLSNTKNDLYYFLVENFCQPEYVLTYSNSIYKLAELIKKGIRKQISIQRATKVAEKLISAAKNVYSAVDDDSPVFEQIDYIISKIQAESNEKKIVIPKIVNLAQSLKEFDELLSIPGLGKTTVVQLIGELGDIRRFRNSNALNAFIGIDLRHYESGNYVANDHISKRGNTVARKILFKSVQSIAVVSHYHPSHINDFYQQKKKQSSERGTKNIAIATMHRLIRTMYHLVKFNQTYDYSLATR
ncbi:transposase [Limosilactobacillus sp. BG-MG3-A]|uniref:Transposase n=1 Tax=Limosilactobacillus agrestis TaxID=2759748 RepID=A0A7W3UFY2_9LACO|nr:transposase [Limosilactobacillus agrestis]MBB1094864.1 transposase [Limosilactobacillus agrestis]